MQTSSPPASTPAPGSGEQLALVISERDSLLVENVKLKDQVSHYKSQSSVFEKEVQRLNKMEQDRLAKEASIVSRLRSFNILDPSPDGSFPTWRTSTSLALGQTSQIPRSPNDLDVLPDELLPEILRHLHQPFHFYHYSNALLGLMDPPSDSKPWNPVGLQLVCRQWRDVARPLFYAQVAFDARDETSLDLAADALEDFMDHPLFGAKDIVWMARHVSSSKSVRDVAIALPAQAAMAFSSECLRDRSCSFFSEEISFAWNYDEGDAEDRLRDLGCCWEDEGLTGQRRRGRWQWPTDIVHPNHLYILRLPLFELPLILTTIFKNIHHIPYLPRFQVDFPYDLLPPLLETIFPTLASIVQDPSLPKGRDVILEHTGNVKKIIFGTHSEKDAGALRGKIEELGELEVVEVVVLKL